MAHASRVTVLRGGRSVAELATSETNPDELLAYMMGRGPGTPAAGLGLVAPMAAASVPASGSGVADAADETPATWGLRPAPSSPAPNDVRSAPLALPVLEVREVTILGATGAPAVRGASLGALPGQIVGVAGVDGSGQRELAEAIVGLRPIRTGRILVDGVDVAGWNAARRMGQGIAYIPEDRQREGLILDFSVAENLLLGRQRRPRFGGGRLLDLATVAARGDEAIRSFRVRAPNSEAPVLTLSGGNQQKVLVARALAGSPRLLVAMQPTRGLDVGSTQFVYQAIRDACRSGMAAVVFSLDLDEILDLSDVVAVMYDGAIVGALPRRLATVDRIGRLMVGAPDASGAAREGA
jgi:simple sugar transport system ATP-binding protein